MWFRKLKVVNVGPFADLSLELTRGSVGVFGRNGVGKSTLINLLYGLVTNDFSRFDGMKADMVRNTAGTKDESYVWGEIEHGGQVLELTRNFRPTKSKPNTTLMVNGDAHAVITNADKAAEEIRRVLGVDNKLLDLYVFKTQDRIYDFLTTTPGDRAKAYQVLCRTEKCEKLWDMLGEFLNTDREVRTEVVDNSDELTVQVSELEAELATIDEKKKAAAEKLCEEKFLAKYEKRVKDADRLVAMEEQRLEAEGEVSTGEALVAQRGKALESAKAELDEAQAKYEKRKEKADDTRGALKAFESYKAYRRQRKRLNDEKDALAVEAESNKPPTPHKEADKLDAFNKQLVLWERELEQAKKVVAAFQATGQTACPTCRTPVDHLKEHLEEQKKLCAELPAKIKALEDKVEAVDSYRSDVKKYEKWKAGFDARAAANAKSLDALQSVQAPDGDEDELKAWLEKFGELKRQYEGRYERYRKLERDSEKAEAALAAAKNQLAAAAQKIAEIEVDPAKVEKARTRLAEHRVAENEVSQLEGEEKGVRRQVEAKQAELKKLRARLKRTRKVRSMAKVVADVREVLHRDRLPKRVAVTNLARMEGDVNEGLGLFGDPFWVESNHELSFTVHKGGEPPQAAGRLSTGQRVVLALAFWPAVASLWATDLGMLALDEPTANLDADNRKFLAQALGAMTAKVRGQRQLIMVTHDHDLRSSFDQVIDLGG